MAKVIEEEATVAEVALDIGMVKKEIGLVSPKPLMMKVNESRRHWAKNGKVLSSVVSI